ncbi:MAG: ABC transporter ATP-binding protein [Puniceicoccaceae bacterium]
MNANSPEVVIRASHLAKSYQAANTAIEVLNDLSFEVRAGESVSIRGESGSGKSTLLNILAGLERRDRGELFWKDHQVAPRPGLKESRLRGQFIGMVFQSYYLIPEINALENVVLAGRIINQRKRREIRERAESLLLRLGLKDRLTSLPSKLSGGERQRVAVARALINQPSVVLADEPTGNLDEVTGEAVMRLLLEIVPEQGAGLVLVTHHPGFASWTDRSLFLSRGKLEESSPYPSDQSQSINPRRPVSDVG